MSHAAAVERTLDALRSTGKLEAVDDALVEHLRIVAAGLDGLEPSSRNYPQLSREFLLIVRELRGDGNDAPGAEAFISGLAAGGSALGNGAD